MEKRICKRAIRRMNKEVSPDTFGVYDYPKNFNAFDCLSILIQSYLMDEINPYLDDYIWNILEDEAEKAGVEFELVDLYNIFRKMLDDHYYLKKIQNFVDRL